LLNVFSQFKMSADARSGFVLPTRGGRGNREREARLTSTRFSGTSRRRESVRIEYGALRRKSRLGNREAIVSFRGYRQSFISNKVTNVMQIPFLNFETVDNMKRMSRVINAADEALQADQTRWKHNNDQSTVVNRKDGDDGNNKLTEEPPDECLIRAYLEKSRGLHVRRTIDEFYYSMLPSTEERNNDQILKKSDRILGKPKSDDARSKVVIMVDQLWLWMFEGMYPSRNFESYTTYM
jgi:hypothetical protein